MIDYYNLELTPSEGGKDCLGNGEHYTEDGEKIEICCDECDHFIFCHKQLLEDMKKDDYYEEVKTTIK